jgi:HlyD family secretion protein
MHKKSSFFKNKITITIIVIVIFGTVSFFAFSRNSKKEDTLMLHRGDFIQQVTVSGKVIPAESVELSFSQGGRVSAVYAKVGDLVSAGTTLASVENGDLRADVSQKEAALSVEETKLKSLKQGTRSEEIAVSQSNVRSAETTLAQANDALVDAIRTAFTNADDAIRRRVDQFMNNPRASSPTLALSLSDQSLQRSIESQRVSIETILNAWQSSITVLDGKGDIAMAAEKADTYLVQIRAFLDKVGFAVNSATPSSTISQSTLEAYRADVTIARTNVQTAVTSLTSSITAAKNAATALVTAEKNLALKEAGSTPEDIAVQEAEVKSARANVESAQAKLRKTLISAPFAGVVTRVDAKVGSVSSSNTADISLISASTLQIESYVPEINLPLIHVGDEASVTLDAYGEDVAFPVKLISIDPAETIRDGVSTYRAKFEFLKKDDRVRSGMTANVVITTEKKTGVLSVPQGVVTIRDGQKFVTVKEDEDTTVERGITTGSVSSLGYVEILSGLIEGDEVVLTAPDKK